MDTLEYFIKKYNLNLNQRAPIEILKINRLIMAQSLAELGFSTGAEVGVATGVHSELLFQNIPNLMLYCIDPWQKCDGYNSYSTSLLLDWYAEAVNRLSKYNCVIKRQTSMDAVLDFDDQSLDFVYLDGAHDFKHIAEDICEWIKKIRPGGILFGHDFTRIPHGRYHCHVKDVVEAYANSHDIDTWFILGMDGKSDGLYREGIQSWMFIC